MTQSRSNVGHVDAIARRVSGTFAVLAGVVSIDGFFRAMPFLTWLVLAFMLATGLFFITGGMRGGTLILGIVVMALTVLDGWLAVMHMGRWALLIGLAVGVDTFITARIGYSPINAVFGKDTHDADAEWSLAPGAAPQH